VCALTFIWKTIFGVDFYEDISNNILWHARFEYFIADMNLMKEFVCAKNMVLQ
jgi:hypothetical protein